MSDNQNIEDGLNCAKVFNNRMYNLIELLYKRTEFIPEEVEGKVEYKVVFPDKTTITTPVEVTNISDITGNAEYVYVSSDRVSGDMLDIYLAIKDTHHRSAPKNVPYRNAAIAVVSYLALMTNVNLPVTDLLLTPVTIPKEKAQSIELAGNKIIQAYTCTPKPGTANIAGEVIFVHTAISASEGYGTPVLHYTNVALELGSDAVKSTLSTLTNVDIPGIVQVESNDWDVLARYDEAARLSYIRELIFELTNDVHEVPLENITYTIPAGTGTIQVTITPFTVNDIELSGTFTLTGSTARLPIHALGGKLKLDKLSNIGVPGTFVIEPPTGGRSDILKPITDILEYCFGAVLVSQYLGENDFDIQVIPNVVESSEYSHYVSVMISKLGNTTIGNTDITGKCNVYFEHPATGNLIEIYHLGNTDTLGELMVTEEMLNDDEMLLSGVAELLGIALGLSPVDATTFSLVVERNADNVIVKSTNPLDATYYITGELTIVPISKYEDTTDDDTSNPTDSTPDDDTSNPPADDTTVVTPDPSGIIALDTITNNGNPGEWILENEFASDTAAFDEFMYGIFDSMTDEDPMMYYSAFSVVNGDDGKSFTLTPVDGITKYTGAITVRYKLLTAISDINADPDAMVFTVTPDAGTTVTAKLHLRIIRPGKAPESYGGDVGWMLSNTKGELVDHNNIIVTEPTTFILSAGDTDVSDRNILLSFKGYGEKGSIEVTRYHGVVTEQQVSAGDLNLTVPKTLPKHIATLNGMFYGSKKFNQDLSTWDVSHITDMSYMFNNCSKFNQPLNGWDVSNVTNMKDMFYMCTNFNQPLDKWDTSNVTDMNSTFGSAHYFNQDISMWNVSKVTDMINMFSYAASFEQDLSSWCVSLITKAPSGFDVAARSWTKSRPVWGTCPSGEDK